MKILKVLWITLTFILSLTTQSMATSEFKYSYMPKKVYSNQLFAITVIGIESQNLKNPKFTFDEASKIQPISNKPLIIKNGNDSFYTFYFKASANDVKIPKLFISSSLIQVALKPQTIISKKLKGRADFSGIIAADMKIKNSQVSNYDEKSYITTISIEAFEANLDDINLTGVQESGIEEVRWHNAKASMEYYIVTPVSTKEIKFTYYNTIKKQYIVVTIPIVVNNSSISTQSNLNPKEDSFEKLKKFALIFLSIFFFFMTIFKRDIFYLVFAVVSLITLLTLFIPNKKICIKQGANLYILPTTTSTISTKISSKIDTTILNKKDSYNKIEYKNGIIGWVQDEDTCSN